MLADVGLICTRLFVLLLLASSPSSKALSFGSMQSPSSSSRSQTNWILRPSTLDDEEAVNRLLWDCYSQLLSKDYPNSVLEPALPMISKARPELLTCGTWYVVEDPTTGALVGCGGWTRKTPKTANDSSKESDESKLCYPHIRHVATHPSALRKGVATALWNRIWEDVSNQFGPRQALEVYSTITAQPFYRAVGFVPVQTVFIPLTETCKFESVLMRREVS